VPFRDRLFIMGMAAGLVAALLMVGLNQAGVLDFLEYRLIDWRFRLRGERKPDPRLLIAAIDEASFTEMGLKWPWPRTVFARAVDRLAQAGAAVIALDIIMSEPAEPGSIRQERALAAAARRFGRVVFASKLEASQERSASGAARWTVERLVEPLPVLREAGTRGYLNFPADRDGFVRRAAPLKLVSARRVPSFALAVALQALGLGLDDVRFAPGRALQAGALTVPLDRRNTAFIDFSGPAGAIPRVSFHKLLGQDPLPALQGRIVLIGSTFLDSHDFVHTPFWSGSAGVPLPGVELHAQVVDSLLSGRFLKRPGGWATAALMLALGLGISLAALRLPHAWTGAALGLGVLGLGAASHYLFHQGVVLDTAGPAAALAASFAVALGVRLVAEERDRRKVREAFRRYLSPQMLKLVMENPGQLSLGGRREELTIVFTDLRGFTRFSEGVSPQELIATLNDYHAAMGPIIFRYNGTLERFAGDGIMIFFGAPVPLEDHADRAVRMAVDMVEEVRRLKVGWRARGYDLDMGVGIATGMVTVGNIGFSERMDYAAIGRTTNLAARLCGQAPGGRILLSQRTHDLVHERFATERLADLELKGIAEPVPVYGVVVPDGEG